MKTILKIKDFVSDTSQKGDIRAINPLTLMPELLQRIKQPNEDGTVFLLAGRPGMGKTGLLSQVFVHGQAVLPQNHFSIFVSLQHKKTYIVELLKTYNAHGQLLAKCFGGNKNLNREILIKETELDERKQPISFTDNSLCQYLEDLNTKQKLHFIIIDSLDLITDSKLRYHKKRDEQLSDILCSLNNLSKKLKCCILLSTSVKRDCEFRASKIPLPKDLMLDLTKFVGKVLIYTVVRTDVYNQQIGIPKSFDGPKAFTKFYASDPDTKKEPYCISFFSLNSSDSATRNAMFRHDVKCICD